MSYDMGLFHSVQKQFKEDLFDFYNNDNTVDKTKLRTTIERNLTLHYYFKTLNLTTDMITNIINRMTPIVLAYGDVLYSQGK